MWILSPYKQISLKLSSFQAITIHYTSIYYYILTFTFCKKNKYFIYTWFHTIQNLIQILNNKFIFIRIRAIGKAYRITKHKHMLHVNMHYPTFKYVIWYNILIKYSKKKKKLFQLMYLTYTHIRSNLFKNLLQLRIPNTYTKRGILNNISIYYNRKQKMASKR